MNHGRGNPTSITVSPPQIFGNAMILAQANSPGLSKPDAGTLTYFSQVAYCPWSMHG